MGIDHAAAKNKTPPFVMAPLRVIDSHAWRALSTTARALWIDLARQAGKTNNGQCGTHLLDIPGDREKKGLIHRGWNSAHTVFNAAFELETLGFIECEVEGQFARGGKTPKLWSLTHLEVYEQRHKGIKAHPARHSYATKWQSVEQAQDALRKAWEELDAARLLKTQNKKNKMQKLHRKDAETASERAKLDAETAYGGSAKMQKLHRSASPKKPRKASNGAVSKAIRLHEGDDNAYMQKLHTSIDIAMCAEQSAGVDSPSLMASGSNGGQK